MYKCFELFEREIMIPIQIWKVYEEAILPTRGTCESAAWDLYSMQDFQLRPGQTLMISTGLIMKPPEGYHIKILARSGNGKKYDIGIPHGLGLIDRDFCGPNDVIQVVLHNATPGDHLCYKEQVWFVKKGDRIAQMIVEKTYELEFNLQTDLPTAPSRGGLGSTNK